MKKLVCISEDDQSYGKRQKYSRIKGEQMLGP